MPITVDDVVRALTILGGEANIEDIHGKVLEIAKPPISANSRQIIRARLQDYCPESGAYRGTRALFENVHGLDQKMGVWRLRPSKDEQPDTKDQKRNPAWTRDELILALDLYFTNPANPPGKDSTAVADLSALLNKLHRINGGFGTTTLRNANGVYLKMMNLRSLDPTFLAQGKVRMQSGGKLEKVVWADYKGRREALALHAAIIRQVIETAADAAPEGVTDVEPYEGEEGGVITRLHRRYERDSKLIREKKKAAKAAGTLACEVCGFDFRARYGELGLDFIEVHHTKPVHHMPPGAKTKLSDLVLLCSNCHRMAHRKRLPLSLEEIKAALRP